MKRISPYILLFACYAVRATSVPNTYNYAQDNKYTIMYFYTGKDHSVLEQKKLLRIFSDVAHSKRYAHTGLKFRAAYLDDAKYTTAQQLYGSLADTTVLILREGRPYEHARMTGVFSEDRLKNFIEEWIGDYLDALLDARRESRRAATAVAYASYPPYWGGYPYYYPYYPYYYGPYGRYGYGGFGMGIYF